MNIYQLIGRNIEITDAMRSYAEDKLQKLNRFSDQIVDARVVDRIRRVGYDVARYAPLLRAAFEQARALEGPEGGVAGLH